MNEGPRTSHSPVGFRCAMISIGVLAVFIIAASAGEYHRVPFSLEETFRHAGAKINQRWLTGTEIEYRNITSGHIMSYSVVRNETKILLDSSVLDKFNSDSYQFSSDGKYALIGYDKSTDLNQSQPWVTISRYVVYSIDTGAFIHVDKGSFIQHAEWFPGRNAILYIRNNNIYRLELSQKIITYALTEDGAPGAIYNGICDWLYKEEVMRGGNTTRISPDGTQMIYLAIDDQEVGVVTLPQYGKPGSMEYQYPKDIKVPYAKPGTPLSKYTVWHVNFTDETVKSVAQTTEGRELIVQMEWVSNSLMQFVYLNKVQNESVVDLCHLNSSREVYPCRKVSEDRNSRGWASLDKLFFSKDADRYLMRKRVRVGKTEYYHLQVVYKNGSRTDLTPGSFWVTAVRGWNEDKRIVYFKSPRPGQPSTDHVFAVHESRREKPYCMTCRLKTGANVSCRAGEISFNSDFTHFIGTCLGPLPKFIAVYENVLPVREPIKILDASLKVREWMRHRLQPRVMNLKVPLSDSMEAEARLLLPPSIDTSTDRKYPLVIYVYAGPNTNQISDLFKIDWSLYLTTNKSIIYGIIDGRGRARKGTEMMYAVYRTLGVFEMQDQITVTRNISNVFSFIDKSRIGIWGWSYGGYATTKILEADVGGVFKCGAAVAPVTDWIYYNSIYTERYMDMPSANAERYRNSSTLYDVENLRNKEYLLIHGTADDNVHYQNTMHLARVLEQKNIFFQQEAYPDERHSIDSLKFRVFSAIDRFWDKCFGLSSEDN